MFSRLEEDTKKQIEKSKNGTSFFADYYKDYIKEEYIDKKGKTRYIKKYIGDYYSLQKGEKKHLFIILICLFLALGFSFYAGIQYVEFNYIWYINLFQIAFIFITIYIIFCNIQAFFLNEQSTRKDFDGSLGNIIKYLPFTTIMIGIIILFCLINVFISSLYELKILINILYYLLALSLNYYAYRKSKNIKYQITKGSSNV